MDGWQINVWGVRGSFPAVGAEFADYGGNTVCISVDLGDALVALDAGSGLASLGRFLLEQGRKRVDILIGHLHVDHIMGLLTCPLLFEPGAEVRLYGPPGLREALTRLVGPPFWPVNLADCRARVELHELRAGETFPLAGLAVTTLAGNHPGGCLYYRLEGAGRSLVYALDCELTEDMARQLTAFTQGADLLIWDASFASGTLRPGWGHSTWEQGLELGRAAGAKRVLMSHYNSGYTDEFLQEQERLAGQAGGLGCFSREGMVIEL